MSELDAEALLEQVKRVASDANDAVNGVADSVGLSDKVDRNPYGAVAAAVGLGYVVGGGLLTSTTMRILRLGLKLASVAPLRNKLLDLAEDLVDDVVVKRQSVNNQKEEETP